MCVFVSAASQPASFPRGEFRGRDSGWERYASLFPSAYVCLKKDIARTDVEGSGRRSVGVRDEPKRMRVFQDAVGTVDDRRAGVALA